MKPPYAHLPDVPPELAPPIYRIGNDDMRRALGERGVADPLIWQCPCCDNVAMYGMGRSKLGLATLYITISATFYAVGGVVVGLDNITTDLDDLVEFWRTTPHPMDAGFVATWLTAGLREALIDAWPK